MGELTAVFQVPEGGQQESWRETAHSDRMRENGFKLEEGRFRIDIGKIFFNVRVVRQWNRFPSEL